MQMTRFILPLSLAFAVFSAGFTADVFANPAADWQGPGQQMMAHGHKGHKNMTPEQREAKRAEMKQRFAEKLGLTAEQQSRIDAIHESFRESHKDQFEAMKAKKQELKQLKESGASEEEIQARRAALKQEYAGMRAEHEQLMSQVKAVLTPEQVEKFEAMKAEHHQKWEKRGKKGCHGKKDAPAPATAE